MIQRELAVSPCDAGTTSLGPPRGSLWRTSEEHLPGASCRLRTVPRGPFPGALLEAPAPLSVARLAGSLPRRLCGALERSRGSHALNLVLLLFHQIPALVWRFSLSTHRTLSLLFGVFLLAHDERRKKGGDLVVWCMPINIILVIRGRPPFGRNEKTPNWWLKEKHQMNFKLKCYSEIHSIAIRLFGSERANKWLENAWAYERIREEINENVEALKREVEKLTLALSETTRWLTNMVVNYYGLDRYKLTKEKSGTKKAKEVI